MKTYCKLIDVHCDFQKDSWECHSQLQIVLQWWETKRHAFKEIKRIGWITIGEQDCCPYCKDKLTEKEKL